MTPSSTGMWITDPAAYQEKLQGLIGDRNPLEVMGETPRLLQEIISANEPAVMQSRPYDDKWTPNEVIGHMVDTEWVFGFRLRLIYCQETPTILGMEQNDWVSRQQHNASDPAELVETFAFMRSVNLRLWKRASKDGLQRAGKHNERGEESLGTMRGMCAGHDLSHLDQIRRYLEALKRS